MIECIVYADHPPGSRTGLEDWLEREPGVRLDAERDDDRGAARSRELPDGFLHVGHRIEAEPKEVVARLLPLLWDAGVPALAALDYEAELPERGGCKRRAIPWPA